MSCDTCTCSANTLLIQFLHVIAYTGGGGASAAISLDHFFHSLKQYYLGLRQDGTAKPTPTGCAITPQELEGLQSMLRLIRTVAILVSGKNFTVHPLTVSPPHFLLVEYSTPHTHIIFTHPTPSLPPLLPPLPHSLPSHILTYSLTPSHPPSFTPSQDEAARVVMYENQTWLPVASLFGLIGCSIPRSLKADILTTLAAFARSPEIAGSMWHTLESAQVPDSIQCHTRA